jgi:hypothetical protein
MSGWILKNQKEILVFPSQSWSYPNIVIAYNNHPKKKRRRRRGRIYIQDE